MLKFKKSINTSQVRYFAIQYPNIVELDGMSKIGYSTKKSVIFTYIKKLWIK